MLANLKHFSKPLLGFFCFAACHMAVFANIPPKESQVNLSLEALVQLTLQRNPEIEQAVIARPLQKFQVEAAIDAFRPQWDVSGTAMVSNTVQGNTLTKTGNVTLNPSLSLVSPFGTTFAFAWDQSANLNQTWSNLNQGIKSRTNSYGSVPSVSLVQPLLRGANPVVNYNPVITAKETEVFNFLQLQHTINRMITESMTLYYHYLQTLRHLDIQKQAVARYEKIRERTTVFIREGRLAQHELLEIESQLAQQQLNLHQTEVAVNTALEALKQHLRLNDTVSISVSNDVTLKTLPKIEKQYAIALAEDHSVDLLAQRNALSQAERALEVALDAQKMEMNVSISHALTGGAANGSYGQSLNQNGNFHNNETVIGLTYEIPIGNSYQRRISVLAAQTEVRKARVNETRAQNTIEVTVASQIEGLKLLEETFTQSLKTRAARDKSAESTRMKFQEGLVSSFELSQIEDQLTQSELNAFSAKINYLKALAQFDEFLGTTLYTWNIDLQGIEAAAFEREKQFREHPKESLM